VGGGSSQRVFHHYPRNIKHGISKYGWANNNPSVSNTFPKNREGDFGIPLCGTLPSGIYFVKVNGMYAGKFVKE
jgi:hypothetical protein